MAHLILRGHSPLQVFLYLQIHQFPCLQQSLINCVELLEVDVEELRGVHQFVVFLEVGDEDGVVYHVLVPLEALHLSSHFLALLLHLLLHLLLGHLFFLFHLLH